MKLSEQLIALAGEFKAMSSDMVALGMLKEAGYTEEAARKALAQTQFVKTAASSLSQTGINYEEAVKLVKSAGEEKNITAENLALDGFGQAFEALMKVAEKVQALENSVEEAEATAASALEKVAEYEAVLSEVGEPPEVIEKKAAIAERFNLEAEEVEALSAVSSTVLEKLASARVAPVSMGVPGNMSSSHGDAMDQFLFGG